MKNTVRIQRNGSTKHISTQPQTVQDENTSLENDDTICLALFSDRIGTSIAQIALTRNQVKGLIVAADPYQAGLNKILELMIARTLLKDDGLLELEHTVAKARALLELLAEKFDHLANREGSQFEGPEANKFCHGIGLLTLDMKDCLDRALKKVFAAAYPKAEVAS